MNFELIDNFIQVGVMLVAAVADIIFWFRQKDRIYIILALEHGCFMMGTLYYVLYLFIRGDVPQIFYGFPAISFCILIRLCAETGKNPVLRLSLQSARL